MQTTPAPPAEQVEPVKGWTSGGWTKGPLRIEPVRSFTVEGRLHAIVDANRFPVCFVPAWDRPEPGEENGELEALANAHLLFAAPALYEALADMLAGWRYIRQTHGDLYGVGWDRAQSNAEAALTSARSPQQAPAAAHEPQEG